MKRKYKYKAGTSLKKKATNAAKQTLYTLLWNEKPPASKRKVKI